MNVISFNENLLERLSLLLQNSFPNQVDEFGNSTLTLLCANFLLIDQQSNNIENNINQASPFALSPFMHQQRETDNLFKWIIILSKKQFTSHQNALEIGADIYRWMMAKEKSNGKMLFVKKERCVDDNEKFNEFIKSTQTKWLDEWNNQLEKTRKLGESKVKSEYVNFVQKWLDPSIPLCKLAYFEDLELARIIRDFFDIRSNLLAKEISHFNSESRSITESGSSSNCSLAAQHFIKPPSLHWSNYPREGEIQITFKFSFPKGTVTEPLFRLWVKKARDIFGWEYTYEWTNGILMRSELTKIALTRNNNELHIVEISGRVDLDEVVEDTNQPAEVIWPYLLMVFRTVYVDLSVALTLPFTLHCIFIGELFFNHPEEDAVKITARSLDAIHTLSSIERTKSVKFRADQEKIYSLNLSTCFPVFLPTCFEDLSKEKAPIKAGKSTQMIEKMSELDARMSENKDGFQCPTSSSTEQHRVKLCHLQQALTYSREEEEGNPSPPYLDKETKQHFASGLKSCEHRFNKRRVSFGVIRAIPSIDEGSLKKISNEVCLNYTLLDKNGKL